MNLYFYAFIFAAVILGFHIEGLNGLYLGVTGYDIFMHILGGMGIGLLLAGLIRSLRPGMARPRTAIILGVLLVGLGWELFEIYYDLIGYPFGTTPYYIDTVKDLIDDMIGGALVAHIFFRR